MADDDLESAEERKASTAKVQRARQRWRDAGYDPHAHWDNVKCEGDVSLIHDFAQMEYRKGPRSRDIAVILASLDLYELYRVMYGRSVRRAT